MSRAQLPARSAQSMAGTTEGLGSSRAVEDKPAYECWPGLAKVHHLMMGCWGLEQEAWEISWDSWVIYKGEERLAKEEEVVPEREIPRAAPVWVLTGDGNLRFPYFQPAPFPLSSRAPRWGGSPQWDCHKRPRQICTEMSCSVSVQYAFLINLVVLLSVQCCGYKPFICLYYATIVEQTSQGKCLTICIIN